jgi:hypothetical protein
MYEEAETAQIKEYIESSTATKVQDALFELLQKEPRNDQAWTIAAQLTPQSYQRNEFLRQVFECSNNADLADWAFDTLVALKEGSAIKMSDPPFDFLVIKTDRKLLLDDLLDIAVSMQEPENENLSMPVQGKQLDDIHIEQGKSTIPLISLRGIGKIFMITSVFVAILLFIDNPLNQFVVNADYDPFCCCFIPLLIVNGVVYMIGFFVRK